MAAETPVPAAERSRRLRRLVDVEPPEIAALLASFAMFFALLSAYYIIRPVRDEIGVTLGEEALRRLFTIVFFVMVILVPLFGYAATRLPRRRVLPAIYVFFSADLVVFWLLMKTGHSTPLVAGAFFVWASVFNLFVVSLFWSLMSELWTHDEAKRLYGFISAGGTAGALAGPLLTQLLVRIFPPSDLLLASAVLLAAAMAAALIVRRLRPPIASESRPAGGGVLDGALKVATTPLFARIAIFIFLANVVGTFFYLEQARLVSASIADRAERVIFFSGRDLAVSVGTILIEVFGTAQVLTRFGVTTGLLALPVTALIGALCVSFEVFVGFDLVLGADAALMVIAAVMVAERIVSFALANPAVKVIYTLATPEEKYKVQNFIDTVVFRGGDAVSGWLYAGMGQGMGFASYATAAAVTPLLVVWIWIATRLGISYRRMAESR